MKKGLINSFQVQLPKMDEVIKQTYTDHEIMILLKKPDMKKSDFPEYRNWVLVNYMLGTGNRAGTMRRCIRLKDMAPQRRIPPRRLAMQRKIQGLEGLPGDAFNRGANTSGLPRGIQ